MKKKHLIPLLAFLALVIILGYALTRNPKILPSTLIDKTAPGFSLSNVADTKSSFSPQHLLGKKWVLNVWASWCVSCRTEHPLLNNLAAMNLAPIVGLNYKDELAKAQQWLKQRGDPYIATPADVTGRVGIEWGVVAVPETFVIDEQGRVIFKHTGPIDAQILDQKIIPLLQPNKGKS